MTTPQTFQASLALGLPAPHSPSPATSKAKRIVQAATILLPLLEQGLSINSQLLRQAMRDCFDANDNEGGWKWKDAYEACEIAQILFLQRYLPQMRASAAHPRNVLPMLANIANLIPTHTKRSDESQLYQQFSTPLDLAYIAALAGGLSPRDTVLEPSAGTGMLAVHAQSEGAALILNELAATRADMLAKIFPQTPLTRFNAENIDDYLPRSAVPTLVLMNPPFSAKANVTKTVRGTDMTHIVSTMKRLAPGGRLVAITGAACAPDNPDYAHGFEKVAALGRILFTAPLSGKFFYRHGTSIETRLTVIDRIHTDEPAKPALHSMIEDSAALLDHILDIPRRAPIAVPSAPEAAPQPLAIFTTARPRKFAPRNSPAAAPAPQNVIEIAYEPAPQREGSPAAGDTLYEPYRLDAIHIPGAKPHKSLLVQSAAMASVRPPMPTYRPHLPENLITESILSDAQLESTIYAGEAHSQHLSGRWTVNESCDVLTPANDQAENAIVFRRGWFLGDGTGVGKGRQIASIILDNWLKGRRRALWISKNDPLMQDAQRDWNDLGQEPLQIVSQGKFKPGTHIALEEGILFTTYATLRSEAANGKGSRLDQIVRWLGKEFDGVIIFDEAHAMGNAAPGESDRGKVKASLQGLAGLRLQNALPEARVVYVSATGATIVENLAYAARLGFWGSDDFPFKTRAEFIHAMESGGLAAMEVLARDAKALGLYASRNLSYEGVEISFLEHELTPEQTGIYNAYADAFQVIHQNLETALEASNISDPDGGTLNRQAKSAARSAFESNKQRFFNHLITAMKMPSLIPALEADIARGDAPVLQLVTTSEALMERRLARIPPSEWNDLNVDMTPREYVAEYLLHSFPITLYEVYEIDEKGRQLSRPVIVDGQPVICREAEALRDDMLESLAALPPVQSALDQIIQHFGTDTVAEITGRGRRIVRKRAEDGRNVLAVENRSGSANVAETEAFMDDRKKILVFSDAGGTGRSYHADLSAKNQRRRIHYVVEPGWKADAAIQGLGRTHRTNQASAPLCRPVATDVRGEKRFLSTIARRLDSLGAITKGQRQTGGQGLFRPEDNLESKYAHTALRRFYVRLAEGKIPECSLFDFQDMTGLSLTDQDWVLRQDLPPMHTFLNRLLALRIETQNALFKHLEDMTAELIEDAIAAGTYEIGLETITAESLRIVKRSVIEQHASGAETLLYEVDRKHRTNPMNLEAALIWAEDLTHRTMRNRQSGRAAILAPSRSRTLEDGTIQRRYRLIGPVDTDYITEDDLKASSWEPCEQATFIDCWKAQLAAIPEFITSKMYVVTGLLLPVWNRLPNTFCRIYRFTTDEGERVIGRPVSTEHLESLGIVPVLAAPDDIYAHLLSGGAIDLAEGIALKRSLVMNARRIELTGFNHVSLPGLKAMGAVTETIAYTLRAFVPTGEQAPLIIARILKRYPPTNQSQRRAA